MDLTDKNQLLQYLKQHGLYTKQSLGQNFLVDSEALAKIVAAAEIEPDDFIIEIGPGVGTLTTELVKASNHVVAVEMDDKLAEILSSKQKAEGSKLEVINEDILKLNVSELTKDHSSYKVVANIPYYITSKILKLFLTAENKPSSIVLLVQKEVAERICAKPGEMSVLAISVQTYGVPEIVGIVGKESFFPSPKVDSAILRIKIADDELSFFNQFDKFDFTDKSDFEKEFFQTVKIGYASKRKTLVNNLSAGFRIDKTKASDILKSSGLSDNARAQELSLEQWAILLKKLRA